MPCSICAILEPRLTNDTERGLPAAYHDLIDLTPPNYREEVLKKCPECGAIYEYCQWTPGGSDDAMQTSFHERLLRVTDVDDWFARSLDECARVAARGNRWAQSLFDSLASARAGLRGKNH